MKIHRLYVDQKGESHFEDVEIKYVESSRSGRLSARLPPAQHPVAVDDEGGAVGDVALLVEHAVGGDRFAVDVAQQREAEPARLGEGGVAEPAVGADRQQDGLPLADLLAGLTEAAQLGRSDAAPVVAVEDEDDVLAPVLGQADPAVLGVRQRKVGSGLVVA